jgi:hypothetical protein
MAKDYLKIAYDIKQVKNTMDPEEEEILREKLAELKHEHKDLDDIIERLSHAQPVDFLQMARMKKRKLVLKDIIQKIESSLLPDIIA